MSGLKILMLVLLFGRFEVICAASPMPSAQQEQVYRDIYEKSVERYIAWLNKPWVGDDRPYAAARVEVETAQQRGTLDAYINAERSDYAVNPNSYIVQFKYFYAIWLNKWENGVDYTIADDQNLGDFDMSVRKVEHPTTYNFTRMVALCDGSEMLDSRALPFVERLVAKDPTDLAAQHIVPGILADSADPAVQERAIKLATVLVSQHPNAANLLPNLGYAYYRRWLATKDPVMKQKSIEAYQHFLDIAKPNNFFRITAQQAIHNMQRGPYS